ncbi:hypothetical protein MATL_G00050470 [Megalops atlanticus]|uniref:Ig-like domain-containing protein n=1 Tax=Megalops atlanticus TaxID=7932 RepID=A0A9D3QBL2_MEGAT|nr:hypothetical protein MATL_G00050470 [Megalops atlanticus]
MPTVHMSCTVDGRVILTCSVERGDDVILHWMMHADLSNYTLNTTSTTKHHILYLGKSTPGQLVCVAGNQVSQKYSVPITVTCRARVSTLIALGIAVVAPTLTIVILKLKKKLPKMSGKGNNNAQEVVYTEIMGHRNVRKEEESDKVSDVVYGQVKVTENPDHTEGTSKI